jgi:8-oxo-dGTP pyrophosphatase MutT (NUDIX family)
MPISPHLSRLREAVGHSLLLLPAVTIVVFDDQGRVLLVQHTEGGTWLLPGGSIEPGERPADTAVREIWEETGLRVTLSHVIGIFGGPEFHTVYSNGDEVSYVTTVFEAQMVGGEPQPDGQETLDLAYFSPAELAELAGLAMPAWLRLVLDVALRRDERSHFQKPAWQPPSSGLRKAGISHYMRELRQLVGNQLLTSPGAGGIVFNEQGQVLLQQRADNGQWNPPAGAVDPHESPADAVVREVWEETGLLVEPVRLVGVYGGPELHVTYPNGDQVAIQSAVFECRVIGGQPSPDGQESLAVSFFPVETLTTGDLLPPRWQRRFADALRMSPTAYFEPPQWQPE